MRATRALNGTVVVASLPALIALYSTEARAQQPEPPFGPQPPFNQPQPGQPPAGQPPAGQPPAGQPPAGQPDQPPAGQPAPGQFGEQPPAGQPAPGQFGAQGQFGAGAQGSVTFPGQQPPKAEKTDEWKERDVSLINQNSFSGGIGMMRTMFAGGGVGGTFRVGFIFDYFTTSAFLCDPDSSTEAGVPITCSGANREDDASHVGGFFSLSATPLSFLEAFVNLRTYANSNSEGSPQLLQVLGDTTIGLKGYTPAGLLGPMQIGADAQLLLLNGTGDVGVSGGATSAVFHVNATLDFRKTGKSTIPPPRVNLNLGYKVDNSGVAVEEVEQQRAGAFNDGRDFQPITRIERYGLGINKVDSFPLAIGVDWPFQFVQPFIEWSIDVPVNRQDYQCYTNRVSRGDVCLGLVDLSNKDSGPVGADAVPSRFGFGARVSPFQVVKGAEGFRGLSALVGFEVGTTGTSVFVEELAPQAPWTLYLGIGFAVDVKQRPVEKAAAPPAPQPVPVPAPQSFVRGFVHEQGKQEGVANAIVSLQGGAQPPVATGADGRFLTRHLEPGTYTFDISAPGFKPGTCTATVVAAPAAAPPPFPGAGGQPGAPGAAPGQFGAGAPGQFTPPPQKREDTFVDADCPLEALPRTGNVVGTVKETATGNAVSGAVVTLVDSAGQEHKVTADGSGTFKAEGLPPGEVTMRVEATGFMRHVATAEVRASEDAKTTLSLNKRPKNALVKIQGNEIKLSEKILFETDSAKILGQSSALLEEIAEVFQKNPNIEQVEIQGHTDNTGGREHNQKLSDARAASVRDWLIKAGVSGARLQAKGYGQDRPIAPNVTEANRAKNRRVQFIIVKKK